MEVDNIYRPPQADMEAPAPQALDKPATRAPFFQTSPLKVAVLSIATFGLYRLVWFYRHWARRREHGEDVSPLGRTLFIVFFVYGLFQSVNEEIDLREKLEIAQRPPSEPLPAPGTGIEPLQAGLLALLFIGLSLVSYFVGRVQGARALGLGSTVLSCVPLAIVQKKINELNASLGYDPSEGTSFTAGSIAAVIIGAICWIPVVIGLLAAPS